MGQPGVGLGWQEAGAIVCVNEIATALALATVAGSFVLGFDEALDLTGWLWTGLIERISQDRRSWG
ncbi:hypothetical protein ADL19_12985 [Streptomyces purpurogeneiscleroticus]|nr:hypothetical protein ADL19_12985 [Streptomyces purpurogeneiscleroticus]